jgi:uncharacterized protein YceK
MRARRIAVALLVAALPFALSGCGALTKALTPAPKVVTQEATMAVAGAKVSGELAKDMPAGMPLWPGATVEKTNSGKVPGGISWSATLHTQDAFNDVYKGVGAGMQKAGWTVEVASSEPSASAVFNVSGTSGAGSVAIMAGADGGSSIDYVIVVPE